MAVIGQFHLLWRNRVPDHIYHGNTIVRIVPTEVVHCIYVLEIPHLNIKREVKMTGITSNLYTSF